MVDVLSSIVLLAGGVFILVAGLGLLRFQNLLNRMHAATKASGASFVLILIALCLREPTLEVIFKSVVAFVFVFLTLPVAAHLLGRSSDVEVKRRSADAPETESKNLN